ncbi:fido domain-containing protein [Fusarium solani]|uniref:Fido domain-containing protein n=1 Tax=Fusarium solani TaxID=169388 RepID=A0A9P9KKG2_FUSSL|nr:fido domain-containing protein [Fusarium solani]KAH7260445.1 fido domain-containing protein [Fusarium solani]
MSLQREGHLGQSLRRMMTFTPLNSEAADVWPLQLTIVQDEAYDYNSLGETDPDDLHSEFRTCLHDMMTWTTSKHDVLDEHLVDLLSRMIFGSNMIEDAGGGLEITLKLCGAIFRGQHILEQDRNADYQVLEGHLRRKGLPHAEEDVIQAYREITKHTEAAYYIIKEVCLEGKELSEAIILETHRLLTYKIDAGEIPWNEYAGVYRKWPVCTGFHQYMTHSMVPTAMKKMISSLEDDVKAAIDAGGIDPVVLAAKYCHVFVNIHPFLDGNGRTCRLILNAILLKYGGTIVCIGEHDEDRQEYLRIASNASFAEGNREDMEGVPEALRPKYYKELASFVLLHARNSMVKIRELLEQG